MRLLGQRSVDWQNRAHLLAISARMMRRILLTHATAPPGRIPAKELAMVRGWAFEHRAELLQAWDDLKAGRRPGKIEPLE